MLRNAIRFLNVLINLFLYIMKKLSLFFIVAIFALTSFSHANDRTFRISKNLSVFNSVFRELDANYVDTLAYNDLTRTAINQMLAKLDPYTVYISDEETSDLEFMTTGEYAGIGSLIMKRGNDVYISEPYEGMPAQRNDVRAGDIIVEIDGKKVSNLSVSEVSNMLKGTPNTLIKLKLKRFGEKKLIEKSFMREKIQMHPLSYKAIVAPKIGFVQLTDFTDKSAAELKLAVNKMITDDNIESLIIDLRNNGGGLIDEAVKILGYFLPKGTAVVSTKGKIAQTDRVYKTPTEPIFPNIKLAILVNGGSASASEILAGAVQDLDRGVVVGERTFGKGLVQSVRPVEYGGFLKVTTAKYYIPSGRCVQALDYSHRNEDGSVGAIPDSLTKVFRTANGRPVRDGGGVTPDTTTIERRKLNIAYYLFAQHMYFDFATEYFAKNSKIAKPSDFVVNDAIFASFVDFLKQKDFKYNSQTEKSIDEILKMAEMEGLDVLAKEEFAALKAKLQPDIAKNLEFNKADVVELLGMELVRRYYYQTGEIEYGLRNDQDLKAAIFLLENNKEYNRVLGK